MGKPLTFSTNERDRQALDEKQLKEVKRLYSEIAKDIDNEIKKLSTNSNVSSRIKELQLKRLKNEIGDELNALDKKLVETLENGMDDIITETCKETDKWLKQAGFKQINLLSDSMKFHKDIIETIVSGQLYDSSWSLNEAIWGNNKKNIRDINSIIAKGIGENKSSFDIAKDLEKYVNPSVKKSFDWGKVYPGTNKKIDYNAQRLARTMTSHAYQEATIRLNKYNPFTKGLKWETSNSHTEACEICKQRATQDIYNLGEGVFPVEKVPLDHPNGKCTLTAVSLSMDEVRKQVTDWYNSPQGTYPDIDKFAYSLGYNIIKMPDGFKHKIDNNLPREMNYLNDLYETTLKENHTKYINNKRNLFKAAKKLGISVDELDEQIKKSLDRIIDKTDVGIRIRLSSFEKVLQSGRFKNQFETGTSGGFLNFMSRYKVEEEMFNVGPDADNKDRPIYGMLMPKFNANDKKTKDFYSNGPGYWYGEQMAVIMRKDRMLNNMTISIGDSLDYNKTISAIDATKTTSLAGAYSNDEMYIGLYDLQFVNDKKFNNKFIELNNLASAGDTYFEAQLHGKQSHLFRSIEKVVFNKDECIRDKEKYKSIKNQLDMLGIPYEEF